MLDQADPLVLIAVALLLLAVAGFAARLISRWAAWQPAGPIALIAASPVVPRVPLLFSLSLDDLLPLLGVAMLLWQLPIPRLASDRILRAVLLAVAVATLARVASALVNGGGLEGTAAMLAKAVARPALLVAIAAYSAIAMPEALRRRLVGIFIATVGTFEAAFGVVAFSLPLPGGAGIEAARKLTTLYGVCPGRINGTLGLSPNHLGAVFVVSLPFTLGLAVTRSGWQRWAWGLAAAFQAAALVLTFTRSSILLGGVLVLAFLVYHRRFVLLGLGIAVAVAVAFAALSMGCTTGSGGHGIPSDPGSLITDRFGDSNDRLALWYAASKIMIDHPLVGVGLGKMDATLQNDPARYGQTPFGPATSSAHNTVLLAGAETGVAGAIATAVINIALGLLVLRAVWRGGRRRDPMLIAAALAVGGYLVQGMVNNLFEVGATSALLALAVGAMVGQARIASGEEASSAPVPAASLGP
jgi:O-antigen ligase